MDFIFGVLLDKQGRTSVLIFVDRFSKMVHLAVVAAQVTVEQTASLFLDCVFRHNGLPENLSCRTVIPSWSDFLPLAEFALNNGVHASSGLTPFFVNNARHPRLPALLAIHRSGDAAGSALGGGGNAGRSTGPSPV
ncbi:hypothetical protein F441_22704 [Phytophthora nicotianae CJ01A1]|uniref:Integrase catalytic domain-containing protein n=1 Tax=Phytophthora nicotianae CJ01A1 TaxID=1317063 RepID=W2VQD8_PHYNI|nr:hypothetical protein F441_22704 [Phytophthora nicotianae CJ01A1]